MATIRGGDRLVAELAKIAQRVAKPATLEVGFPSGSTEADGTSLPMIAAIQEFGAPSRGIPPRPFFRNMIAAKSPGWPAAVGDLLVDNDYDAVKTLGTVGEVIVGQLQDSIRETNSPPLKDATIVAKGGKHGTVYNPKDASTFAAKPLVDTGTMFNSVKATVKS